MCNLRKQQEADPIQYPHFPQDRVGLGEAVIYQTSKFVSYKIELRVKGIYCCACSAPSRLFFFKAQILRTTKEGQSDPSLNKASVLASTLSQTMKGLLSEKGEES